MSEIRREVFIDKQMVNVNKESAAGYMFESPIFRDISKILSNRATTYKLPKTSNNLKVFGLSDNPDVVTDFPYKKHDFEEWRDGLLFIRGVCTLLSISDTDLELSVIWGNTINLLSLKDMNLRDLNSNLSLAWDSNSQFLSANNTTSQYGYVAIDFGRGLGDFQYIHPSITIRGILDMITQSTGVQFQWPSRFEDVFKKRWIPLLTKNANEQTWESTYSLVRMSGNYQSNSAIVTYTAVQNQFNILNTNGTIGLQGGDHTMIIDNGTVNISGNYSDYDLAIEAPVMDEKRITKFATSYNSATNTTSAVINYNETFYINPDDVPDYDWIVGLGVDLRLYFVKKDNPNDEYRYSINTSNTNVVLRINHHFPEVPFGYDFPIAPNLPDMKITDFIKQIMQMYGLWTYYNFRNDNVIEFISLEDIYAMKPQAYDWTHKLVETNKGRFNVTFAYGDYAQNNYFRYDNDDEIKTDADGILAIDNETIFYSKEIVKLQFSPSKGTQDTSGNTYAYIPIYDAEGELQSAKNRVLNQGNGYIANEQTYRSAIFDTSQYFGGENGLLANYYSEFQYILRHPVIVECYVYLQDMELHQYKEALPVYIDGVFYMPINVTVQTDGLAVCQLIKMPVKE